MNVAELTKQRIESRNDGEGISCKFIRIDDHRGIKFYRNPDRRDKNREMQALGAIWGFCPKVYGNVDLPDIGFWGYEVELVKVAGLDDNMPVAWRDMSCIPTWKRGAWYANKVGQKAVKELAKRFYEVIGWQMTDLHEENYGFTNDGRLVIIDVGC